MKKTIDIEKFKKLEVKYNQLCMKHNKLLNKVSCFEKMPQALANFITKEGIYFKRVKNGATSSTGIIYLQSTKIKKGHCDVCGKRRKTTAHHVIPKRTKSINKELSQLRIRVCSKCDDLIHPENGFEESLILRNQKRDIDRLRKINENRAEQVIIPFKDLIERRISKLILDVKSIPKKLSETPKRIKPALSKIEGRIKELKYLKRLFREDINKLFETRK